MAKKIPSNFYQEVNVRKLNNVFDSGLPSIGSGDNGKVVKVVENKFALSEDLHTTVVANPEGSSTDELMTLKVGETIYAVNKPTFETIKALKITIENGGQYKTNKPIIEFYDDGGNKANITSSDYTVVCDKTYAGSANLEEVCSIDTPDTPGTFMYTFVNDFDTNKYHFLKLTRGGTFVNDIAKNIKVELSSDGENFLTLFDETTMTWSDAVTYHMYDIATGEEASTILPIVTSADNGQVLSVVNGAWGKSGIPYDYSSELLTIPIIGNDGIAKKLIPSIAISPLTSRIVVDNDGYYESDCAIFAVPNFSGGYKRLTLTDIDNFVIGLITSVTFYANVNDGNANINLVGHNTWNNSILSSTTISGIRPMINDTTYVNVLNTADKYEISDLTFTNVNSDTFHFKFKLNKITTT